MTTAAPPATRRRAPRQNPRPGPDAGGLLTRLTSPVTEYYLLWSVTTLLVVLGLVMVLSASSVNSMLSADGSPYAVFTRQLMFAVIGAVGMTVASRVSIAWWKRLSLLTLMVAVIMQALVFVPSLGVTVNGNRNWLKLGPIQIQPAEIAKIALILVGAMMLANKRRLLVRWRHAVFPYVVPVAALTIGLVLGGKDLGTGLVMFAVVAAVLYVAGVPGRLFALGIGFVMLATAVMVRTSDNRMSRITNWLSPECGSDPNGMCGQSVHGMYALADGGWWGVGLGASREKWRWLAEPHNDFIFAIIGEELGLPGTLVILALFAVLAWACFRVIERTRDQFVRIATAGVMAWVIVQAMINIGAVIGVIPVIGVPLPLVSAGGSSLVTTMVGLGMVLSFARTLPGASERLASRRGPRALAVFAAGRARLRRPGAGGRATTGRRTLGRRSR